MHGHLNVKCSVVLYMCRHLRCSAGCHRPTDFSGRSKDIPERIQPMERPCVF